MAMTIRRTATALRDAAHPPARVRVASRSACLLLVVALALAAGEGGASPRNVSFSGLTWKVRSGSGAPGNGCWSDDPASVWVDEAGLLHLKIRKLPDGRWCQAQVTAEGYADYGDHLFWANSRIDQLADSVVLGMFLYADDYHEIDIEATRAFGGGNLHYVVQPYYDGAPRSSYDTTMTLKGSFSSHRFTWSADRSVAFGSWHGHCLAPPCGGEIASWRYAGPNVPLHEEMLRPYVNLWIRGDDPPAEQEVVVERYRGARVSPPSVATAAASAVTTAGATLEGTANPNGWPSFGWFEYGLSTLYDATTEATRQPLGEGTAATPYSKAITGLACGVTYHYRAVASNVAGRAYGDDTTVTPPCPAPVVTTAPVGHIGETTATFAGTVNPNGASADAGFDYGATTAYGGFAPAGTVSGVTTRPIAATATALLCGSTYHVRARASHAGGTGYGPDVSFTTAPCSGTPPRRRPVRTGG